MKNLLLVAVMAIGFLGFSQEKEEVKSGEVKYKCSSSIKMDSDSNTIELIGNVEFATDLIEFINADKIIYNRDTDEVVVYKPNKIVFHGSSMQVPADSKKQIINYKIGDKVAYMN